MKLNHDIPSWVSYDAVFFITINCAVRGENSLALPDVASALFEGMPVYEKQEKWWIHLALLMPDHLHMLVSFGIRFPMDKIISDWKRYCSRQYGIKWQKNFFDHRIRSDEQYAEKYEYIRNNPVRKRLSQTPDEWPYVWIPERK